MRKFISVVVGIAALATFAVPADAASTFTIDTPPQVDVTTTIDSTALCPSGGCSFSGSVSWRSPGCCGSTHTIIQLERNAVMHYTATALDASRPYVTIQVNVGIPNPVNHLVKITSYGRSFVVAPAAEPIAP